MMNCFTLKTLTTPMSYALEEDSKVGNCWTAAARLEILWSQQMQEELQDTNNDGPKRFEACKDN